MMKNQIYKALDAGYPNSDSVMKRGMLLPVHHGLTTKMLQRLHNTIDEFVGKF